MNTLEDRPHDIMQVCRNGHVITDLLRTYPERGLGHCDRCGASTIDRCPTCGLELPGAVPVPGLVLVGRSRVPRFCAACGAPFPWANAPRAAVAPSPLALLEMVLRRLPFAVRQLRHRHGGRSAFRVEDVHDLEDLLRALLPLHFDDVRPENRTPSYAPDSRTDFLLASEQMAVVVKRVDTALRESELAGQWAEDAAYYRRRGGCQTLIGMAYDPEGLLVDPPSLEASWGREQQRHGAPQAHFVIAQ